MQTMKQLVAGALLVGVVFASPGCTGRQEVVPPRLSQTEQEQPGIPHPKSLERPSDVPESLYAHQAFSVERRGIEPDEFIYLRHALLTWNLAQEQTDPIVKAWVLARSDAYCAVWKYCDENPDPRRWTLIARSQDLAEWMLKEYRTTVSGRTPEKLREAVGRATARLSKVIENQDKGHNTPDAGDGK